MCPPAPLWSRGTAAPNSVDNASSYGIIQAREPSRNDIQGKTTQSRFTCVRTGLDFHSCSLSFPCTPKVSSPCSKEADPFTPSFTAESLIDTHALNRAAFFCQIPHSQSTVHRSTLSHPDNAQSSRSPVNYSLIQLIDSTLRFQKAKSRTELCATHYKWWQQRGRVAHR